MNYIDFYIAKEDKSTHHTLRAILTEGDSVHDVFVKVLSFDPAKSIKKANSYIESFTNVSGGFFEVSMAGRIKELSQNSYLSDLLMPYQNDQLRVINTGYVPFGAFKDSLISDLKTDYLTWCCKSSAKKPNDILLKNLSSAAIAVMVEKGGIKSADELKELMTIDQNKKPEKENNSSYFGMLKQRLELNASIILSQSKFDELYQTRKYFYKMLAGDDVIIYSGATYLGETGQNIRLKATVKKHDLFRGTKTTHISCPKSINK